MTPVGYGVRFGMCLTHLHAIAAWSGCHPAGQQAGGDADAGL
jgi:hypothetical protein